MQPTGATGAAPQQQQQQGGGWAPFLLRIGLMYLAYSYFFGGKKAAPVTDVSGKVVQSHANTWKSGEPMSLYVYLSEEESSFDTNNADNLVWEAKNLFYDWKKTNNIEKTVSIVPSENLQHNGSLFAHIFFVRNGKSISSASDSNDVIYSVAPLVKFRPRPKLTGKKNLLSGEDENKVLVAASAESQVTTISGEVSDMIGFWKPNLTLHLIHDFTVYPSGSIPAQMTAAYKLDAYGKYLPPLYLDEFWLMKEHLLQINKTSPDGSDPAAPSYVLPLTMTYSPMQMWKWQMQSQLEQSLKMQESLGGVEGESEEFKRMLTDTNPYLLGVTFVVSILHSVFDFLAFKNDITFWKNNKSMEGLSVKTILLNAVCQTVIFLYLLDNNTSWLILFSAGAGLLIEFWKIQKAMIVKVDWSGGWPKMSFEDKQEYVSKTKEFDEYAMKKLSYVLYVLIVGYSIYSLMYESHKSWYSWILGSLVGTVYTFGFVMMMPQLFINYKLKSVAHLPWKTFMYKALNTFIDDLFAFIIKMPTLHRLSCLRDDLIFLIYLYQRWIYPVDKKRTNEFGQNFDEQAKLAAEQAERDEANKSTESKKTD